jgi:PAS domain S-box-containing protein
LPHQFDKAVEHEAESDIVCNPSSVHRYSKGGRVTLSNDGLRKLPQNRKTSRAHEEASKKTWPKGTTEYRSLFERALEGVFRSTPEGRFTAVNPALVSMLGYASAAEVLALTLPDELYADPRQRASLRANYEAAGKIEGVELRWKKKNGEPLVVNLYARTIRNAHGHVIGCEGLVLDITERKRMEEALRQSEARYRTVSDLISDYAYAVRIELDGRTVVEWVTKAFNRLTGFTVRELAAEGGIIRTQREAR